MTSQSASRDYEAMTDDEVNALALLGDMSAEMESRHRALRVTEITVYVCLRCGEDIGHDAATVFRDTGQPWRDPFKPGNVQSWHESFHDCPRRGWLLQRRPRTAAVTVKTPT